MNLENKKILLTGGSGFLGKCVEKELLKKSPKDILIPRSCVCDLRDMENCLRAVEDRDVVIHLAGNVGGIEYNQKYPATLFYENLIMGAQLMEAARLACVSKFVTIGTICSYPKFTPVPFKEEGLWNGYPEETNAPYGLAKKMLLVQGQAYRKQYGFNAIYLLQVNLYGPGDNFHPEHSHVIPALIRKIAEAKETNKPFIEIWGTGEASREFLYAEDAAKGIVLATEKYDKPEPINLGAGMEIKIKDLVWLICEIMEYEGKIRYDKTKPDGQPRRMLEVSKAAKEFGFKAKIDFREGLKKTIDWYLKDAAPKKI